MEEKCHCLYTGNRPGRKHLFRPQWLRLEQVRMNYVHPWVVGMSSLVAINLKSPIEGAWYKNGPQGSVWMQGRPCGSLDSFNR